MFLDGAGIYYTDKRVDHWPSFCFSYIYGLKLIIFIYLILVVST